MISVRVALFHQGGRLAPLRGMRTKWGEWSRGWGFLAVQHGWAWQWIYLYASMLFGMGELESEILCFFCASVVKRHALTQPQRRRGTKDHSPCLNSPT